MHASTAPVLIYIIWSQSTICGSDSFEQFLYRDNLFVFFFHLYFAQRTELQHFNDDDEWIVLLRNLLCFQFVQITEGTKNLFRKGLIYTGKTALWCADIYPLQQLIDCLWSRCTMYMDIYMDAIYSQIVYCQFFCFALWQSWIVCARKERGRLNRVEACIQ